MAMEAREIGFCSGTVLVAERTSGNDRGSDSDRKEGPGHEKIRRLHFTVKSTVRVPSLSGSNKCICVTGETIVCRANLRMAAGILPSAGFWHTCTAPIYYSFLSFYAKILENYFHFKFRLEPAKDPQVSPLVAKRRGNFVNFGGRGEGDEQ